LIGVKVEPGRAQYSRLRNQDEQRKTQMTHTPHELAEEFPDQVERMSALKQSDAHFSKLFDDYHEINRAVHRAETDIEPTDDLHMAEMRKQRLALKDAIWQIIGASA